MIGDASDGVLNPLSQPVNTALRVIGATIVAGILAGLGAVGFHYVADTFGELLFAWADAHKALTRLPVVLLVPPAGLFCIGIFLQHFPQSRKGGVVEVIEALGHDHGKVPLVRILNVIISGLVLAVGGSVGPEGPMVQLGALIGSQSGQWFGLTRRQLETLVRAGAAAGIGTAFRSPAGGVLLTLEIFGARFNRDLTAISIACGIGYLVRTAILGDAYPFRPPVPLDVLPTVSMVLLVH